MSDGMKVTGLKSLLKWTLNLPQMCPNSWVRHQKMRILA